MDVSKWQQVNWVAAGLQRPVCLWLRCIRYFCHLTWLTATLGWIVETLLYFVVLTGLLTQDPKSEAYLNGFHLVIYFAMHIVTSFSAFTINMFLKISSKVTEIFYTELHFICSTFVMYHISLNCLFCICFMFLLLAIMSVCVSSDITTPCNTYAGSK